MINKISILQYSLDGSWDDMAKAQNQINWWYVLSFTLALYFLLFKLYCEK